MKATIGTNAILTATVLVLLGSFGGAFATEDPDAIGHETPLYPEDPLPPQLDNQDVDEGEGEGTVGIATLRKLVRLLQGLVVD